MNRKGLQTDRYSLVVDYELLFGTVGKQLKAIISMLRKAEFTRKLASDRGTKKGHRKHPDNYACLPGVVCWVPAA
jgi:hypothetical protein